ncbi:ABC transporter permease [Vibrio sp.]|nr:ABC transporter permease [Vibrio viridaestus]MDC0609538.1 ABC transporter permease [Vibrio sp.]
MTYLKRQSGLMRGLIGFLICIFLWQIATQVLSLPKFILPSPFDVFTRVYSRFPILIYHAWVTLQEMLLGLGLGLGIGFLLSVQMLWFKSIRNWLLPLIIISQALPVFAIAPIMMLWLGYGIASKVVMAAIIIFFPITSCCFDGISSTPTHYLDLSKTLGASKWQQLLFIRLPAALPAIASGIRISVVIAPIGAIAGEWVGSSEGLGYLMLQANARMMVDDMFAALFLLSCMSILLYQLTDKLLKRCIYW